MKLKYRTGPDAPGYLIRMRSYLEYQKRLEAETDEMERQELLLDWLASYLTWPPTRFLKRVWVRLASRNEFEELLRAVTGSFAIDPKKDESSDGG